MNRIARFFHEFFHPHCADCRDEKEISEVCQTCEELKQLLAIEKAEKRKLLDAIIYTPEKEEPKVEEYKPILPKVVPWNIKREMLEAEDRKRAQILKDKEAEMAESRKSTEELEKELGISPEVKEG